MMLRNILTTLAAAAAILPMSALEVSSQAGALQEAVGDNAATATSLVVSGTVNYTDLRFVAEEMPSLATLDLSHATIAAFAGEDASVGGVDFPANQIPEYSLMGAKAATIILPSTVTAIGDGAFAGNKSLTAITIPASVTTLGENLFNDCTALTSATIAANVAQLPASTFSGCTALTSVSLPETLTAIGAKAFAGTAALSTVEFPLTLATIGEGAFYGSGIRKADLEETALTAIGPWAFANCANLTAALIPATVATIGEGAFFADASLWDFTYPTSTTYIPDYALKGDESVRIGQVLHSDVATIGNYALADLTDTKDAKFPPALTHLGDGAMANWESLETLDGTNLKAVPTLGTDVWEGVRQMDVKLEVSPSLQGDFITTPQWKEFNVTAGGQEGVLDAEESDPLGVKAWFEGMVLHVESLETIDDVMLYDLAGRRFVLNVAPGCTVFTADTAAWDGQMFIVRVLLGDARAATFKLIR